MGSSYSETLLRQKTNGDPMTTKPIPTKGQGDTIDVDNAYRDRCGRRGHDKKRATRPQQIIAHSVYYDTTPYCMILRRRESQFLPYDEKSASAAGKRRYAAESRGKRVLCRLFLQISLLW